MSAHAFTPQNRVRIQMSVLNCSTPRCLLIRTLFETGARISEALDLECIDVKRKNLHFRVAKARRKVMRTVQLSDTLHAALVSVCASDNRRKLFSFSRTTAWREVRAFLTELEISCSPHCFRHDYLIRMAEKMTVEELQKHIAHYNLSSTLYYLNKNTPKPSN